MCRKVYRSLVFRQDCSRVLFIDRQPLVGIDVIEKDESFHRIQRHSPSDYRQTLSPSVLQTNHKSKPIKSHVTFKSVIPLNTEWWVTGNKMNKLDQTTILKPCIPVICILLENKPETVFYYHFFSSSKSEHSITLIDWNDRSINIVWWIGNIFLNLFLPRDCFVPFTFLV